jgi:flavin-dependent dehydrogenase
MKDIIIVGAGPVGLYLAGLLKGLDFLVLDRNLSFGKKADSGLYSSRLADFIQPSPEWIEHEVLSARLHSPSGQTIELRKPSRAAYVVDREKFTCWMADKVREKVLLKTAVNGIEVSDRVVVKTNRGTHEARMLAGCDGASSIVRRHFGIRPAEILNGLTAIKKERNLDRHVDIYFDKSLIKDGFFWKIPRGETTEYGALGKNVNYRDLERFFRIKNYRKQAAFMNLGLFRTYFQRTLLVGEAAGQVKPWSLGGIIFGFTCARIASQVILEAFEKNDFSEDFLKKYDREWKRKIGRTIRLGLFFRKLFVDMDNETLESHFRKIRKIPFLNRLDMDFPRLELFG